MQYFTEQPDKWVILRITNEGISTYKLLCGWYGGYCGSDEWRLSSAIISITKDSEYIYFTNASGSVYKCHKDAEGTTSYTQSKYMYFKSIEDELVKISIRELKDYENI